jgi:hypothetical protein
MKGLCEQHQDQMTDHVLGLLDQQQQEALLNHIQTCTACANALRKTQENHNMLSAMGRQFEADMPDRIDRCIDVFNQAEPQPSAKQIKHWRNIMSTPLVRITTAAVVIIAAVLAFTLLDKSVTTTYAIEQTIKANRGLHFIHLKYEPAGTGVEELWAQFDVDGELQCLRMNFPNTEDGPKDVVWKESKAEVWFKAKQSIAVFREKNVLAQLKMSYRHFDPKLMGEQLYQAQIEDSKQIAIQHPQSKDDPITITWTRNGDRVVYAVDPETKLLQQYVKYRLKDGDYKFVGRTQYLDYNQSVDPDIFILNPPADVVRADQTTQEVGMAQGTLNDEEIASELARQFLQALIDQNYTKAGKLIANVPAKWVKQQPFGKTKYMRIVSVGKPEPYPANDSFRVPCQVEIEKDGQLTIQSIAPCARQVYGQPERWQVICVL